MRRNIIPYFLASKVVHFSVFTKFFKAETKLSNPHHRPSIERKKEAKKTKINLDFILYESELLEFFNFLYQKKKEIFNFHTHAHRVLELFKNRN